MNLIFKQISSDIESVLKTFEIKEKVMISLSKQPEVDYQVNTLVKHQKNENFEQISSAVIKKLKEKLFIKAIIYNNLLPHNGCRPKKIRRK